MKQCIIIHGGEAFDTEEQQYAFLQERELDPRQAPRKKRRDRIAHALSHEREVFVPQMPNAQNASYRAWKIRFEKYFPYLDGEEIVLVWNSLGGRFLSKRLSENTFPKSIKQLHLVAACISAEGIEDEWSADFDFDHNLLVHLHEQCEEITLYHSRDDEVVPYRQAELLKSYLPKAELLTFETRNHFFQPALPELLEKMRVYKL